MSVSISSAMARTACICGSISCAIALDAGRTSSLSTEASMPSSFATCFEKSSFSADRRVMSAFSVSQGMFSDTAFFAATLEHSSAT